MVETLLVLLQEMNFVPVDLKAQNGNHVPFPLTGLIILSISTLISVMTNLSCPSKLSLCLYNSKNRRVGAYTRIYLTGWCHEIKGTVSGAKVLCSYCFSSWEWPSLVSQAHELRTCQSWPLTLQQWQTQHQNPVWNALALETQQTPWV